MLLASALHCDLTLGVWLASALHCDLTLEILLISALDEPCYDAIFFLCKHHLRDLVLFGADCVRTHT